PAADTEHARSDADQAHGGGARPTPARAGDARSTSAACGSGGGAVLRAAGPLVIPLRRADSAGYAVAVVLLLLLGLTGLAHGALVLAQRERIASTLEARL